jgi:hypothetical protein
MRIRVPGWLLILGSIVSVLLLAVRVDYAHSVGQERADMGAAERKIASGPEFEKLWKRVAAATYESGHDDPALMDLLRKCDITVRVKNAPVSIPPTPGPVSPATVH